jgi:hypothetical protein
MRNLKRVLSLALSLVMVLGLLVITSSAASTTTSFKDADEITNVEAVEVLSALKVLEGDDNNNFNPTQILTRETAAKIICYMLIGPDNADKLGGSSVFSDVAADRWSAGYIAYCTNLGILAGAGDGTFNPEGELTGVAFAKMLLVALGYDPDIEGYVGANWAIAVASGAIDAGIDADLNLSLPLAREDAAQMAFQTLTADLVKYTGGVNVATSDGTNVTVDATRYDAETPAYSYQSTGADVTATAGAQFCEKYFPTLKLAVNGDSLKDDFGYAVRKWYIGSSKTDYAVTDAKTVATVTAANVLATYADGVEKVTTGDLYKLTGSTTELNVFENGEANDSITPARGGTDKALTAYKGAVVEVVDNDNDGAADTILVTYAYVGEVTKVTEATSSADRTITMKVYNDNGGTATTGVTYATEDFAKGDYVLVYVANNLATTEAYNASNISSNILKVAAAKTVEGTVSNVGGTNGSEVSALTVDGTKYTLAADTLATKGLTASTLVKAGSYSFTANYTLILANGYVVGAVGENTASDVSNIVYVTRAAFQAADEYGTTYKVEVVNMDGTVERLANYGQSNAGTSADGVKDEAGGTVSLAVTTATKAYVTANTRILFVSGTGAKLNVTTATGAINQALANNAKVLLSQTDNTNYEIEAIIVTSAKVDVSADVVYVNNTVTGTNANGNEYAMYSVADGSKTTVTAASATAGFKTYSVDSKGVYTFVDVTASSTNDADGTYAISAKANFSVYNNAVTLKNETYNITDLPAGDAVILNQVSSATLTLSDLASADTLAGTLYVVDGVVVAIAVTTYTTA